MPDEKSIRHMEKVRNDAGLRVFCTVYKGKVKGHVYEAQVCGVTVDRQKHQQICSDPPCARCVVSLSVLLPLL